LSLWIASLNTGIRVEVKEEWLVTSDAFIPVLLRTVVGRLADGPVDIDWVIVSGLGQVVDPVEELDRTEGGIAKCACGV